MSRKKRAVPASGAVWQLSAEEATLAGKPRYNGFACGHGVHGDVKYNRAKAKRAWEARMGQEGASRGSFPFSASIRRLTECWIASCPTSVLFVHWGRFSRSERWKDA